MTSLEQQFLVAVVVLKLLVELVELGLILIVRSRVDLSFTLEFLEDRVSFREGL